MSRFNIRKPRDDAHLQSSDVRPKSEVYSNDFLSAFWPEEERAKRSPPGDNRASADVSRFNIRKPRSDQQFDPSERRPKSELYSPDFLHSFWPEEDKSKPRPTGRKVRKGARPFLEHDASCQWMEYMKHPAQEPVSLAKEPSGTGLFPGDAPGHQQGDHLHPASPGGGPYLREQRLSCSPDKGTVYLKETPVQRRPASPRERQREQREPRQHSRSPEKGSAEWYQSQVCLLEEQQRKLFKQQQNLMAIMSNHRGGPGQQQPPGQYVARESSDSAASSPGAVSPSPSHHDVHHDMRHDGHHDVRHDGHQVDQTFSQDQRVFHQTDRVDSDYSLPAESCISIVSHEDSPRPQASRFRQNSARSRKYEETMSRDIRMSMSGQVTGADQSADDQFPDRQRSSLGNYSRYVNNSNHNLLERRVSQMSVTSRDHQASSSRSDVSHPEEEAGGGRGYTEPRRVKRLKGDCAAANAVRMEGSVDQLIYYRKKSASGDDADDELPEETKIFDMNQPLERSKCNAKTADNCQPLERPMPNAKSTYNYQPLEGSKSNARASDSYQPLDRSPSKDTDNYQPLERSTSNVKATDNYQPLERSMSNAKASDSYQPLERSPSKAAHSYQQIERSPSNVKATDSYQPLERSSSNCKATDNYHPLERSPSKAAHNYQPLEKSPSNAKATENFQRLERSTSNSQATDNYQPLERSSPRNAKSTRSFQPMDKQKTDDNTEKMLTGSAQGGGVPHWMKGKSPTAAPPASRKSTGKTPRSPTTAGHAPARRDTPTSGRSTPANRHSTTKPLTLSSRSSTTGNLRG